MHFKNVSIHRKSLPMNFSALVSTKCHQTTVRTQGNIWRFTIETRVHDCIFPDSDYCQLQHCDKGNSHTSWRVIIDWKQSYSAFSSKYQLHTDWKMMFKICIYQFLLNQDWFPPYSVLSILIDIFASHTSIRTCAYTSLMIRTGITSFWVQHFYLESW